ncbi:MAG: leucine--tRNA ligase [Bacteroidetes bacterium]|nr:leucine--tRNA ligase [Bacteroidota bacterium]
MIEFDFKMIDAKWQQYWFENKTFKTGIDSTKPKYYALDMFPYPSGAGLHVGHPLGYIASDIMSRFKRLKGFNVLHPMGFDAFGLPAEQYAIETGTHPAISTQKNIDRYKQQLKNIGFSFDWDIEISTASPDFYRWTQWIFMQLFNSYFDRIENHAKPIHRLIEDFSETGNYTIECPVENNRKFTASEWNSFDEETKQILLMDYRLVFSAYSTVNWCDALGTVLANDEVINGLSERGGHLVVKKEMRQWFLRISEYADRLLDGLNKLDFSDSLKEMQRNWIGRSEGAELEFKLVDHPDGVRVFTTRPDTIFGVTFMVLAPEHELVKRITTDAQRNDIEKYLEYVQSRSDRERMTEVKKITGVFTGAFVEHPFTKKNVPVWISEYVLVGYGTGAIMAVPCGDDRDFAFAKHFDLPITNIFDGADITQEACTNKNFKLINSEFLDGLDFKTGFSIAIDKIVKRKNGKRKVNFRMRDAGFSRQRYWGEPFPIVYKNDVPYLVLEEFLPITLPQVESYKPTGTGEGPLANIPQWVHLSDGSRRETNTMPGYAGSSWYFLRYMDAHNSKEFASKEATQYWNQVDLYIGGAEHAVGHLLYSRMWTKVLHDLHFINFDEPFKKLVNQGMIQGTSKFIYRIKNKENTFVSFNLKDNYEVSPIHIDVNCCDGLELDTEKLKSWRKEFETATFILEEGKYICGTQVEKMSKRLNNVVNPDDIVAQYGADAFRMYEMFLGPVELSKPWDTKGIEGVSRFLRKLWRLFYDDKGNSMISLEQATEAELKILHRTIKKIESDIEVLAYNTCISSFMIAVNEFQDLKCSKKVILEPFLILLSSFAPHITEELWSNLGHPSSIAYAIFPNFDEQYLTENSFTYGISVNGKVRTQLSFSLTASNEEIHQEVLKNEIVLKWLEGKTPKKVIIVPKKIVNIVV